MEIWKPLRNFPDYEGSDEGRIKNIRTQRILKTNVDGKGRPQVCLRKNNQQHTVRVHKVIAETFLGEHPGLDVKHKDFDRTNNHVDNLEWATRSEIAKDSFKNGNRLPSRGTAIRVIETDDIYRSASECARVIGCHRSAISKCLLGLMDNVKGYHFERFYGHD